MFNFENCIFTQILLDNFLLHYCSIAAYLTTVIVNTFWLAEFFFILTFLFSYWLFKNLAYNTLLYLNYLTKDKLSREVNVASPANFTFCNFAKVIQVLLKY